MVPQISELQLRPVLRFSAFVVLLGLFFFPGVASAEDALLDRAFVELQSENYSKALQLLDRAEDQSTTPAQTGKITYYRGFALEKLGQCDAAELAYRRVLDTRGSTKIGGFAREALDGFESRCVPATPTVREVELPRGSGRVGWKVFGWTTLIVGGLTLGALPVKHALERNITSQAEPYFLLQYNCDVSDGDVSGERCDREGLQKDKAFLEYESSLATADKWSDVMLYSGIGLVSVGASTLLLVAVTRPSADDVVVSITPTGDGAVASATFRF